MASELLFLREKITVWLLSLPRSVKRLLFVSTDFCLCIVALWFALAIRLDTFTPPYEVFILPAIISALLVIPIFLTLGLYSTIFRYSGIRSLISIIKSVGLVGGLSIIIFTIIGLEGIPRTIGILQPIILLLLVGASRLLVRVALRINTPHIPRSEKFSSVLIFGASDVGRQLVNGLMQSSCWRFVGFLDHDPALWGGTIHGYPVYEPAKIREVIERMSVDELWLAMPNMTSANRHRLIESVRNLGVYVRSVPSLSDLVTGRVEITEVQDLDVDDLLCRDVVNADEKLIAKNITGKVVLVSGAGGSIGSELCRKIIKLEPASLILVDNSEYALYLIHLELIEILKEKSTRVNPYIEGLQKPTVVPVLASVTDRIVISRLFAQYQPYTVFHAAAYKHLPLVERNIGAALWNNIWGTYICTENSFKHGVQNFVLVSTDKAVRPTNVMGVSKRLSELVVQAYAAEIDSDNQIFTVVRFGNVLGSSGSVVPLFRRQIAKGGPVTLSHREITRYFMTIPEAAQLVMQASGMATGGEVFVLDMGKPILIYDLARRMIEFSGQSVRDDENRNGNIEIQITGLKPGEKLCEELLIGGRPEATAHPKIMKAHEDFIPLSILEKKLGVLLKTIQENDIHAIRDTLVELVPEYLPAKEIIDWGSLEEGDDRARIVL
jgi:FlaA1/EpsC-like NDP-sugar epimerase